MTGFRAAVLTVVAALAACSSDVNKRPPPGEQDAGDSGQGKTCLCTDPGVVLTPTTCSWPDGNQCSGLYSAYCYAQCGGFNDPCFTDCDGAAPAVAHVTGASYVADTCTITIACP